MQFLISIITNLYTVIKLKWCTSLRHQLEQSMLNRTSFVNLVRELIVNGN